MSDIRSFPSKWGTGANMGYFPSIHPFPYPFRERDRLARIMTIEDVLNTTEVEENAELRRKKKWKEIRHLYQITRNPQYANGSIENAMWMYGDKQITVDHFVTAMMAEFKFDNTERFDKHLRWLYWAFEGGSKNTVDWRDILGSFKILIFFRMIRLRPHELLAMIFDVYADQRESLTSLVASQYNSTHFNSTTEEQQSDESKLWRLPIYSENSMRNPIRKIFLLPCESDYEVMTMNRLYDAAAEKLKAMKQFKLTRREFKKLLLELNTELVETWQTFVWDRLPKDIKLIYYKEQEEEAAIIAENLIYRVKLNQALYMYQNNIRNRHWKAWKTLTSNGLRLRIFQYRKLCKKGRRFLKFWREVTAYKTRRRRRRLLAEVMGAYTVKARCFARIKLFNYTSRKIWLFAGNRDTWVKNVNEGLGHVRNFVRLWTIRKGYHRWWDSIREAHNMELAENHNWLRHMRPIHMTWFNWAHARAVKKRNEIIAVDNQMAIERMIKQTEMAAQELLVLEKARTERIEAAKLEKQEAEKKKRLEEAKAKSQEMKEEGKNILLSIQADARKKRLKKEWRRLEKKFEEKWEKIKQDQLTRNRIVMTAYIENPNNKLTIKMRMEKLREDFLAPPTPENPEKEKTLTSPKNIVFLYLEQKMTELNLTMEEAISKFDKEGKGYLSYKEFERLIASLGVKLNPAQISEVIRGVDADGDGFIEISELNASKKESEVLGVKGSPWKFYVDPAHDVICYHNMATNERILEYDMTEKKYYEIVHSNIYAEAETETLLRVAAEKVEDWKAVKEDYFVRRLQYMYRQWAGRRRVKAKLWKVERQKERRERKIKKKIANYITWHVIGAKCRAAFKKQLYMTYEKIWDVESGRLFWYNHHRQISSWERPPLLWRYDDVENPSPWVAIDVQVDPQDPNSAWSVSYYHVPAQTQLPRKPDGLPQCQNCYRNLAARRCLDCNMDYCFACHRDTHMNPMGFFQKRKMKTKESMNIKFLERMKQHKHNWVLSKPFICIMCQSDHQLAAHRCRECGCDYCRACYRRVHAQEPQSRHHSDSL